MVQKEKKYITWEGLNQHAKNTGKKIKEYDAGVIGGYNGSFPLTAATKGNIYLLPATKKYYVCIENYNGSQLTAPNANFEELSVYTNRSKLDNLKTKYISSKVIKNEKYIGRLFGAYIVAGIFYISFEFKQGVELVTSEKLFTFNGIALCPILSSVVMENNQRCRFSFRENCLIIDSASGQMTTSG